MAGQVAPGVDELEISERLALAGIEVESAEAVIRRLARLLLDAGTVRETFAEAAVRREREYPTGLPTPIPVAIPHPGADQCLRGAIAVATLARPVDFGEMGSTGDRRLGVRVVFLLAVHRPELEVGWLKRLVGFVQRADQVEKLLAQPTAADVARYLRRELAGVGAGLASARP